MTELTFEIKNNKEIWELIDKNLNSVFIHKFMPNHAIEWWQTDIKTKYGVGFQNISVRKMEMDVQTDLIGLKKIIELNTHHLHIYQFANNIPDSLDFDRLSTINRNSILKNNGLKHWLLINYEFITIGSFDPDFITAIATNPSYKNRIYAQ